MCRVHVVYYRAGLLVGVIVGRIGLGIVGITLTYTATKHSIVIFYNQYNIQYDI